MPDQYAIRTDAISKSYGDNLAVDRVDLAIRAGEIYGFLGPNGAGKSTCVKMLCTLLRPSGGKARVGGFDVDEAPQSVRLIIGVALQEAALDERQTGRELLQLQARLYGLSKNEVALRTDQMGELVDLREVLDRRIETYSGGMRRRLDLAAALIHNPRVLFLDEPTNGLDPISRTKVWEEVRRVNQELETTIFLTTQYLEEADELADRVGIIDQGRLVAEGAPSELKRSIGSDVVCITVEDEAEKARAVIDQVEGVEQVDVYGEELTAQVANGASTATPVAVALDRAGIEVRFLTLRTPTLDDVFLAKTGAHLEESEYQVVQQ